MACNILTRLFGRRGRRDSVTFTVPASSVETHMIKAQLNLTQPTIPEDKCADFFYLGCLVEQGSHVLIFEDVPANLDINELVKDIRALSGFVNCELLLSQTNKSSDLAVNFITAGEAAMALAAQISIDLGNGIWRTPRYAENDLEYELSRKRVKVEPPVSLPTCQMCCEELDGSFARPCFQCKKVWCYECLEKQLSIALEDQERFPAMCCGKILHFDVARGVVSDEQYMKYRSRFEQHNTTKPIYCAHPPCSVFLPPRLAKPNTDGQVQCVECQQTTCGRCKVLVDTHKKHQCVLADEAAALLVKFKYKSCPRCNAGVARMYGCPHMKCYCGAHWCWECQRPIQTCWYSPCVATRDDGDLTEHEDDGEEHIDDGADSPVGTVPTPVDDNALNDTNDTSTVTQNIIDSIVVNDTAITPAGVMESVVQDLETSMRLPQPPPTEAVPQQIPVLSDASIETNLPTQVEEEIVNLDHEHSEDWEGEDFDFGDEPVDESWDTWGCEHRLEAVINHNIWKDNKEWLPRSTTGPTTSATVPEMHIDCLRCYKTVILVEPKTEVDVAFLPERKDSACDVSTLVNEEIILSSTEFAAEQKQKATKKTKKRGERPTIYTCVKCGMFYCLPCKKIIAIEAHELKMQTGRQRRT